jgi:hypothetical protein
VVSGLCPFVAALIALTSKRRLSNTTHLDHSPDPCADGELAIDRHDMVER